MPVWAGATTNSSNPGNKCGHSNPAILVWIPSRGILNQGDSASSPHINLSSFTEQQHDTHPDARTERTHAHPYMMCEKRTENNNIYQKKDCLGVIKTQQSPLSGSSSFWSAIQLPFKQHGLMIVCVACISLARALWHKTPMLVGAPILWYSTKFNFLRSSSPF